MIDTIGKRGNNDIHDEEMVSGGADHISLVLDIYTLFMSTGVWKRESVICS